MVAKRRARSERVQLEQFQLEKFQLEKLSKNLMEISAIWLLQWIIKSGK
jgi:hypothetical protein